MALTEQELAELSRRGADILLAPRRKRLAEDAAKLSERTMNESNFNPSNHLRKIERRQRQPDGSYVKVANDYLDVKWRIVWLRQEQPNASIETTLLSQPGVSPAVVKATVTLETGVSATGFGQCGSEDWGDWLEKAETRSIGRALALLGFGTQFCQDFDDIITDAPIAPEERRPASQPAGNGKPHISNPESPITANQRRYVESLARDIGLDSETLRDIVASKFDGLVLDSITKRDASNLIEELQARKDEQSLAGFEN